MDKVSDKEKSSRKSREERDRDSPKRHPRDRDHRSSRDEDSYRSIRDGRLRDTEDNHRSSRDGRSRDTEDHRKHLLDHDKYRHHRSPSKDKHDRSPSKDKHQHDRSPSKDRRRHDSSPSKDRRRHDRSPSKDRHRHDTSPSRDKHRRDRSPSRDNDARKDRAEKHRDTDHHRSKDRPQDFDKHARSNGREGSRDRDRVSREESVERRSSKRKDHGDEPAERSEKRVKVSEEKRERRRFEDRAVVEDDSCRDMNGISRKQRVEERKFEEKEIRGVIEVEKSVVNEPQDNVQANSILNTGGFLANGAAMESPNVALTSETSSATNDPPPTKVSSNSTTNENKGVSVTRSHEVPGKSSTDGRTTSAAGKGGNLSLDALAKAKRALQMKKELAERLKKAPQVGGKVPSSSSAAPYVSTSAAPVPAMSSTSTLPIAAAASANPSAGGMTGLTGITSVPNIEAVKRAQELAAKMGFHHDPEFAPLINMFPGQIVTNVAVQQKPAKAPVLRLDALGREIDEHGNVINMPKLTNLSTLKVNINKQKKEAFQILRPELDADAESNPHFDPSMGINKTKLLRPKRMAFQFVEEGKWSKQAEIIRFKNQFGEAQAKELKTKQAQLAKAKAELDINPNLIEVSERVVTKEKPKDPIPDVEWWDVPLLVSGNYGDVAEDNIANDKLKMDKITIYVEHPLPIEPPAEPAPPPPQPLKLTKKEQKKLRTQRRLAKEKDRQEMIRQGLIEPPKPKVKMSNLMKVLGSEATQDPTRLEMEIRSAAAEREQAHVDRNIARKLTPAERREKKERKLFDDPSTLETIVSVYRINDLSHPQTRFKVDVNAQENRLTGCAVLSDSITVVVVEGGSKSIKRYGKLMLRRINWAAAVASEEEGAEDENVAPVNKCMLVWQGSAAKPSFHKFLIHQCRTEAAARKVFSDAGVGHYWDLAVNFTDDQV